MLSIKSDDRTRDEMSVNAQEKQTVWMTWLVGIYKETNSRDLFLKIEI